MLQPWLGAFPRTVLPIIQQIDETLRLPRPLSEIIAHGPSNILTGCENSQPAIFATSLIIHRVLEAEFGFDTRETVDYFLGHSLGEFAALVAAGCLSLEDGALLVRKRAEVMAECTRRAELGDAPPDPFSMQTS